MIIVTCHKCGKEIHKADKCPYCGNSTKFGTVNGMTDIHENAYVEYSELATILDAGDFAKLIEKSRAVLRWMPTCSGVFWMRLLAKNGCKTDAELIQKGINCDDSADFYNAYRYGTSVEKATYDNVKNLIENVRAILESAIITHEYEEKSASQVQNLRVSKSKNVLTEYCNNVEKIFSKEVSDKRSYFLRLQKCKEVLSLLTSAESIITDKDVYASIKTGQTYSVNISIEDLLAGKIDFIGMAYAVNIAIRKGRKKEISIASSKLYSTCRYAEQILTQEKTNILSHISGNRDSVRKEYNVAGEKAHRDMEKEWNVSFEKFNEMSASFAQQKKSSRAKTKVTEREAISGKKNQLGKIIERFCTEFSPEQFEEEYIRLYSLEPSYNHYECVSEMPRNIYISTLEYDLSEWDLCDYTKEFLDRYYYFMYGGNKLYIPYCAQFGQEFNYLFKFDGTAKGKVVSDACNMGIRLFMMLPPGKVNFTFVDPVSLGESFAMFTRLVNIDDRTSEVINGKIWSSPNDIEDKLRIMTDHISNVSTTGPKEEDELPQYEGTYNYTVSRTITGSYKISTDGKVYELKVNDNNEVTGISRK